MYGAGITNLVHAKAKGGTVGALEERAMCGRHCAGAAAQEQERCSAHPGAARGDLAKAAAATKRSRGRIVGRTHPIELLRARGTAKSNPRAENRRTQKRVILIPNI